MVATRSMSVLASFHGSVSARYLFPMRARFIASFCASRNLNTSSNFSTSALTSANSSASRGRSRSPGLRRAPYAVEVLLGELQGAVHEVAINGNQLVVITCLKSFQKSLSFVSGALAVST